MLTEQLAQEIAAETGRIVGFNILITDSNAVIIGSSDTSRLGSVHEASRAVLRTRESASHTPEQARRLQGVLPGITLPLVMDGIAIGTVAISGPPNRVRHFGQVVRRQTEILLQQEMITRSRLLREHAVQELLRDIVFFDAEAMEPETLDLRALELGLDPNLTRTLLLVDVRVPAAVGETGQPSRFVRTVSQFFNDPQDIVAELTPNRIVVVHRVLHGNGDGDLTDRLVRHAGELLARLADQDQVAAQVGIGAITSSFRGLHDCYQDATAALRLGPQTHSAQAVFAIERMRTHQLLSASGQHARRRFHGRTVGPLAAQPDWLELRATLIAWAEGGFNLVRAAKLLHVHRNTLVYRLDKITQLVGRPIREPGEGISLYLACLLDQIDSPR